MATIGIDVSKKKLDLCWLRDAQAGKVKTRVFPNAHDHYPALLAWLLKQTNEEAGDLQVYLEATGIYHEPLAYWLHQAGVTVYVLNPARVRYYARSLGDQGKSDKKDSKRIAHFAQANPELTPWQPEPEEVRTLKQLAKRLETVQKDIQREQNRLEKAQFNRDTQAEHSITHVLALLRREAKRLVKEVDDHIDRHDGLKRDRRLLESIPGIGEVLSVHLLVTLRSRRFKSGRQVAAFMGLVPVEWTSGSSVRHAPRLSKNGDPALRQKLYMGAVVAMQHNPSIRRQYQRLCAAGKRKMSALGAAMRKLVHIAYGVLAHQKEYEPQPM